MADKVKSLKTQLSIRRSEYELLKNEIALKQKESSDKRKIIDALEKEISIIESNQQLKVSEHAILRYFERVGGHDLQEIEDKIMTTELIEMVNKLGGNGVYPCDGFSVKVKDFTIVTVLI